MCRVDSQRDRGRVEVESYQLSACPSANVAKPVNALVVVLDALVFASTPSPRSTVSFCEDEASRRMRECVLFAPTHLLPSTYESPPSLHKPLVTATRG